MTGLRASALVICLISCLMLSALHEVSADATSRKLLQNRPWQQGGQGQGKDKDNDKGGKDRDRDNKDDKGGQNWNQNWGQGKIPNLGGGQMPSWGQGSGSQIPNFGQGQMPNLGVQGQSWGQNSGGSGASAGNQGNNNKPAPQGGENKPQGNPNRNKDDRGSLSRATRGAQNFRNKPQRTIAAPTSGPGLNVYNGLRSRGNSKNSARDLANLWGSNSDAAANALTSAATMGGDRIGVAETIAATTVAAPNVAPALLAKSANIAVDNGQTAGFANTMADTFAVSKQNNIVPQMTRSVADAMNQGGAPATLAFGEAIATAVAQGGDSKAAVAEATATAICEGGSTAEAWSSAYAVALSKDSQGCLVLNEAKAMARAQCGPGAAQSITKAEAASVVLGFCGLLDFFPGFDFNFGTSQSGGSSWGG